MTTNYLPARWQHAFLVITLLLGMRTVACATPPAPLRFVTLRYEGLINGYRVQLHWLPREVKHAYLVGPAILEFYNPKDTTTFTLTTNYCPILKARIPVEYTTADSSEIKAVRSDTVRLRYKRELLTQEDVFGSMDEPFRFADINFDQHRELLIPEAYQAQRFQPAFRAYEFDEGINSPAPTELTQVPFADLDGLTQLDYATKTIKIETSGGACASREDYYKPQPRPDSDSTIPFRLVKVVDHYADATGCYELVYQVNPTTRQRTLLAKKKLKE